MLRGKFCSRERKNWGMFSDRNISLRVNSTVALKIRDSRIKIWIDYRHGRERERERKERDGEGRRGDVGLVALWGSGSSTARPTKALGLLKAFLIKFTFFRKVARWLRRTWNTNETVRRVDVRSSRRRYDGGYTTTSLWCWCLLWESRSDLVSKAISR